MTDQIVRFSQVESILLDELSGLRDDPWVGEIRGRGAMIEGLGVLRGAFRAA